MKNCWNIIICRWRWRQAYIIAMTSIGDTDAGMERLEDALFEIDMNWEVQKTTDDLSVKSVEDRNTSAVRANLQQWGCMEQEKSGAKTEVGSMG